MNNQLSIELINKVINEELEYVRKVNTQMAMGMLLIKDRLNQIAKDGNDEQNKRI